MYSRMVNKNTNKYKNNRVLVAAGGSRYGGSSKQRRHTQGREKMKPSTLRLWGRCTDSINY